jgi:hypothetical protein
LLLLVSRRHPERSEGPLYSSLLLLLLLLLPLLFWLSFRSAAKESASHLCTHHPPSSRPKARSSRRSGETCIAVAVALALAFAFAFLVVIPQRSEGICFSPLPPPPSVISTEGALNSQQRRDPCIGTCGCSYSRDCPSVALMLTLDPEHHEGKVKALVRDSMRPTVTALARIEPIHHVH